MDNSCWNTFIIPCKKKSALLYNLKILSYKIVVYEKINVVKPTFMVKPNLSKGLKILEIEANDHLEVIMSMVNPKTRPRPSPFFVPSPDVGE